MNAAIDPAYDSIPIHNHRARQLLSVIQDRGVHIQSKAGCIGFFATNLKRRIGLQE